MSLSLNLPSQLPVFPALCWHEHMPLLLYDLFWAGEMHFLVYLEDEAARCICLHDTGSLPYFCAGPFGSPPPHPHPTAASRISFWFWNSRSNSSSSFWPYLQRLPCQGTSLTRLTFFRWGSGPHPLLQNVHPNLCWPFQVTVGEALSSLAQSPAPLTLTALTPSIPEWVLVPKRIGGPQAWWVSSMIICNIHELKYESLLPKRLP